MADPNTTYAIDAAGPNPDGSYNVVANSNCSRITVQENYDSTNPPTADLLMYRPTGSSTPTKVILGTAAIFTPFTGQRDGFLKGQVVGAIKTVSGSITVQQVESTQI